MSGRWSLVACALCSLLVLVSCAGRGGVSISVSPSEVTLAPGESVVFTATVLGAADKGVTWSSTGGQLVASGMAAVFTAPFEVGEYTVTARSAADQGRWASAAVTVLSSGGTGVLGPDGGVVRGSGGELVAVPASALAEPLHIHIGTGADPGTPLPDEYLELGETIEVVASRSVFMEDRGTGFIVGLPVPDGAIVDALGAALYGPARFSVGELGGGWSVVRGVYDADEGVLLVVLPTLLDESLSLRLISGPLLVSSAWSQHSSASVSEATVRKAAGVRLAETQVSGFIVRAEGSELAKVPTGDLQSLLEVLEAELVSALGVVRAHGFEPWRDPFALRKVTDPSLEPISTGESELYEVAVKGFYSVGWVEWTAGAAACQVNPDGERRAGGYSTLTATITLCVEPGNLQLYEVPDSFLVQRMRDTIYHELFHAVQARYRGRPQLTVDNIGYKYFVEGTAALAEKSLQAGTVSRNAGRSRRAVDVPLLGPANPLDTAEHYRTQDFWAFIASANGLSFRDLTVGLFEIGPSLPALDEYLASIVPGSGGLADEYWRWALDQYVISPEGPCALDQSVVQSSRVFSFSDVGPASEHVTRIMELWTKPNSYVVRIRVSNMGDTPAAFRVRVTGGLLDSTHGRVRFISPGAHSCFAEEGDASAHEYFVQPGDTTEVQVLASLIAYWDSLGTGFGDIVLERVDPPIGDVSVSVEPDSVTLPVSGSQSFIANVTGASDTSVSWSATCGSIPDTGNPVTYTAPGSAATCLVRATSVEDSSAWGEATVSVTAEPPVAGDLALTVRNVDGSTRAGAVVNLYSDSGRTNLVATRTTDSSGVASFTGLTASTYYYGVTFNPGHPSPSTNEYWGHASVAVSGASTATSFTRSMPYLWSRTEPVWNASTNSFQATFTVRNPGSSVLSARVRLIMDRDMASPYDLSEATSYVNISGSNGEHTFTLTLGPAPSSGTYYYYYQIETSFGITDQNVPWSTSVAAIDGGWIRQFGTSAFDYGYAIAAGYGGDVVVAGYTGGDLANANAGYYDAFLRMIDANGEELWTRQFGATGWDAVWGVAVDSVGDVIAVGQMGSGTSYLRSFVRKFNRFGDDIWTREIPAEWSTRNRARAVAVDQEGNVYVAGEVHGDLFGESIGNQDGFLRKYDRNGSVLWTRQFGTSEQDLVWDVAVDSAGTAYVVGEVGDSFWRCHDDVVSTRVWRFTASGSVLPEWEISPGGACAYGVAVDGGGHVLVVGGTGRSQWGMNRGGDDAYVMKLDANGVLLWVQQFGTSSNDYAWGVAVGPTNDVLVAGFTRGRLGDAHFGGVDAFVARLTSGGSFVWTEQFGTGSDDWAMGVAVSSSGSPVVVGATHGSLVEPSPGGGDVFVRKSSR